MATVTLCPCCGKARCVIGYEEKEILDLEPAKYFVRVIKREKLACRKCPDAGVITAAAGGPQIIEKGKLSDAMVVDIVIKKYGSHLPVYRQQADLDRDFDISLSRSTLNGAIIAVGDLLVPVVKTLKADRLAGGYIQADETPIGVQSAQSEGRNHEAYEFQYSRSGGPVVFDFQMSRGRDGPCHFLKNYGGILQCDGYVGYDKVGASGMVRAGCMAHAPRKFYDALKIDPKAQQAGSVVATMAKLYAVEKEAREAACSAEQRQQLRQSQSKPIAKALEIRIKEIEWGRVLRLWRWASSGALGINLRDYLNDVLLKCRRRLGRVCWMAGSLHLEAIKNELPIGSGLIESRHKHVLHARLKGSGTAWLMENADDLAQLRTLRANDQWNDLWKSAA